MLVGSVTLVALPCLALLGLLEAKAGGAPPASSILRVSSSGALAMGGTPAIGRLFGAAVG